MSERTELRTMGAGTVGVAGVFIVLTIALLRSVGAEAAGQPVEFEIVHSSTMSDGRNPSCSYEKDIVNLSQAPIDVVVPDGTAFALASGASERIRLLDAGQLLQFTDGETTPLTFMVDGQPVEDPSSLAPRCAPNPEQVKLPGDASDVEPTGPAPSVGSPASIGATTTTSAAPAQHGPESAIADGDSVILDQVDSQQSAIPTSGQPGSEEEPVGTPPDSVGTRSAVPAEPKAAVPAEPKAAVPAEPKAAAPSTTLAIPVVTVAKPENPVPETVSKRPVSQTAPVASQPTNTPDPRLKAVPNLVPDPDLDADPNPAVVEGQIVRNSSGQLPFTGGNLAQGLAVSFTLLVAGAALIVVARRHI